MSQAPKAEIGQETAAPPKRASSTDIAKFLEWSREDQAGYVTTHMTNSRLSNEVRVFFARCLSDRKLGILLRNNMAQCLHNQEQKNPELWRVFMKCLNDQKEDRAWRIYCMQHLVSSAAYSNEAARQAMKKRLLREARSGEPDFAARAFSMLDEFQRAGYGKVEELDQLLLKNLQNPGIDPLRKITILGTMGSRGDRRAIEEIRRLAKTSSPAQRVAAATLGRIGDASDVALLEALEPEPGSLLEKAVQGALEKLRENGR